MVRVGVVSVASYPLVFEESAFVVPAVLSAFVVPAVLSAYDVPTVLSVYVVPAALSEFVVLAVLSAYVVPAVLSVFVVPAVWAAAELAVALTGGPVFVAFPVTLNGVLVVTVLTVADPVYIQKRWDYININEPRHEKTNILVSDLVQHKQAV